MLCNVPMRLDDTAGHSVALKHCKNLSEEIDDKPLSVDDTFVICDDRFVT